MCTHKLTRRSQPSGVNTTHLSLLLLLSLGPNVWQSTSSRLACWEIKQMLETNWKTNSPGRQYICQASYSRLALSDRIIPALGASWSSVKLIQHPGYQSIQHDPARRIESENRRQPVSCEKITSGCYDKDGNESAEVCPGTINIEC